MSALGHFRTHAPQHGLFDHLIVAREMFEYRTASGGGCLSLIRRTFGSDYLEKKEKDVGLIKATPS
jgi:hypothetical protein